MDRPSWDDTFMEHCRLIAKRSKDESSGVGCVIVGRHKQIISSGYNGAPRGVNDEAALEWTRPIKYYYMEHAERNAIYNAARIGVSVSECVIYTTHFPCADCVRAIIQCGIDTIIIPVAKDRDILYEVRWAESLYHACRMLDDIQAFVRETNTDRNCLDQLLHSFRSQS